jgi:hypothetical protein
VVEQSFRWGMSPFATLPCASIIAGRLTWEGKLVAAVIEAKLGWTLEPEWNDEEGDELSVTVIAVDRDGEVLKTSKGVPKAVTGTVGEWKTTRTGSPWEKNVPGTRRKMLAYRGSREWCRLWAPAMMLGVLTNDEVEHLENTEVRSSKARDVTPVAARRLPPNPDALPGQKAQPAKEAPAEEAPKPEQKKPTLPPNPDAATDWKREGYLAHGRDIQRSASPTAIKDDAKNLKLWREGWDNAAEDAAKLKQQQEGELDLDLLRGEFDDWLDVARSADNVQEAWDQYVEPFKERIPTAVLRDLQRMKNNRMKQF